MKHILNSVSISQTLRFKFQNCCGVVAVNCVIEAQAYSSASTCPWQSGWVRMNGVEVWSGKKCSGVPEIETGIHIFKIDPSSCTMTNHRVFVSKHEIDRRRELGGFPDYEPGLRWFLYKSVSDGDIVVGVSAGDDPTNYIGAVRVAKSLKGRFNVNVEDVGIGGSFAFVARKGGWSYGQSAVVKVLKDEEGNKEPARVKAAITKRM